MSFVSFLFLPFVAVTACLYFLVPKKLRWIVLLLSSMLFYAANSGWLLIALIGESLFTWWIGVRIAGIYDSEKLKLDKEEIQTDHAY